MQTHDSEPPVGSVDQYPYDPDAQPEDLRGLDKLRAVRDRRVAAFLFELYFTSEQAERTGEAKRWRAEETQRKAQETRDMHLALAERSLRGGYGTEARQLADHLLVDYSMPGEKRMREDPRSLEVFAAEFRKLGVRR